MERYLCKNLLANSPKSENNRSSTYKPVFLFLNDSILTQNAERRASNTNKTIAMVFVAASGLLVAIVRCQIITSNKRKFSNTNHLLPAMARTLMGVHVRPIPRLALIGMPRECTMLAIWGLFESWTELQQY